MKGGQEWFSIVKPGEDSHENPTSTNTAKKLLGYGQDVERGIGDHSEEYRSRIMDGYGGEERLLKHPN